MFYAVGVGALQFGARGGIFVAQLRLCLLRSETHADALERLCSPAAPVFDRLSPVGFCNPGACQRLNVWQNANVGSLFSWPMARCGMQASREDFMTHYGARKAPVLL